jgi:7-cyano-7-deazaguanine synthase
MCGITTYWAREALLTREQYDSLLIGAQQRGQDGFGVAIYNPRLDLSQKLTVNGPYASERYQVLQFIEDFMEPNAIMMASCRATPETEKAGKIEMIQPISYNEFLLTHNGGVTHSVKKSLAYEYRTDIDSEAIIAAYTLEGKNMRKAMEVLSGSFAFLMLDQKKGKLYAVTSFNPLAHMYIKGYGYFYHSDNDVLEFVLEDITGAKHDGMNVWESWYHHDLEPYTIIETDLDSGSQFIDTYTPRFLHPKWDSTSKMMEEKKTYVVASGGIDSGLTTYLLHLAGRDVCMLHFNYGQKSKEAEDWAIRRLSDEFAIPFLDFDLTDTYSKLVDPSMLTKDRIPITSGGDDLKSTIAWVAGRNAVFAVIAMAQAETSIFNLNYSQVDIAAGWSQLSEETGGYPDNSYYFQKALDALKDVGYITGKRINFLPVLRNITKTETWVLGNALGFPFKYTVSCDNPQMNFNFDHNCIVPNLCPNCGSTKLSMIAADRANVKDERLFTSKREKMSEPTASASPSTIIDRLMLTQAEKAKLKGLLK